MEIDYNKIYIKTIWHTDYFVRLIKTPNETLCKGIVLCKILGSYNKNYEYPYRITNGKTYPAINFYTVINNLKNIEEND